MSADKQKISEETQEMKKKSEAAKAEEQGIHKQIREARATGDKEKVKTLEAQLKTLRQANVAGRKADHKDLQQARQELRKDRKAARPVRVQ